MEVNIEILKDEKVIKNFLANFSMKEEYYKFHDYIKKSGLKFEIQEYHDVFIMPIKYSENEVFIELMSEYYEINPDLITYYLKFLSQLLDTLYSKFAEIENSNLQLNKKEAGLRLISKAIKSSIISLGSKAEDSAILVSLLENIDSQAAKYQTPINKLTPKKLLFFYEDMLRELAEKKLISTEFIDSKNRFEWVNFAFYFGSETHNINSSIFTLNWLSSASKLADFLMFLFSNLIEYKFKDKSEFYDWIILHFELKGESFERGKANFETLKRYMKRIKDKTSINFKINESKLFESGYFPPSQKTQKLL
jgi:hypothetical protein